ncbi:MAG: DUF5916 domain-containing protein [Gemmatimonadota bacterium]
MTRRSERPWPLYPGAPAPALLLLSLVALAATVPLAGQSMPGKSGPERGTIGVPVGTAVSTPPAGTPDHDRLAPRARVARLQEAAAPIELDGRLEEAIWRQAPAATRFWQRRPHEREAASQRTEVRFATDGRTLYVGARMYDERGAGGVVSRLVRRDSRTQSDELRIIFDTFHDHLGQTMFAVNPSGVRRDAYGPGGSFPDNSWDPVWRARAHVDSLGWTAEMAIPFSQLRFPGGEQGRWGVQIERTVQRLNEEQWWSFWGLQESGGPTRYGHLEGLGRPATGTTRLELLPYAVSRLEVKGEVDPADPFQRKAEPRQRYGADLRYLLTSNLTLNATFNPDFGQAEVDPAVVNLSDFETFFPEKREFFIQGRGLFDFGTFWCKFCSNTSSLGMLFTRRIGRSPQAADLARAAGRFAKVPVASTILGAAKITGRLGSGTSVGVLSALTDREQAAVGRLDGERLSQEVAPLTHYFVSRVKQDYLDGDLQVGGLVTSVVRDFSDPALAERLNRHSEGAGLDAEYWWNDRSYHLLFSGAMTNISGTPQAILRAQTSSARYFQRPDHRDGLAASGAGGARLDSTLTSLKGYGLYARVAKDAGNWQWETALNVRSPGFENNDIAFLTRTDFIWLNANLQRSWTKPTSWYRQIWTIAGAQQQHNFDGDLTQRQLHGFFFLELPFYWSFSTFGIYRPEVLNDRLTRGGPVVKSPRNAFFSWSLETDSRKPWILELNPSYATDEEGARDWRVGLGLTLKPRANVALSLNPAVSRNRAADQFVTSVDDPTAVAFFGRRYVFADLDQRSLSMTTRLNVTFSPTMSLELFAQPLISANDFQRFKQFDAPRRLEKSIFGEDVGSVRSEGEGFGKRFFVDPDGEGPAEEFSFSNRDFNFRSLRGNLVFRWEYRPGSTLFFVWTQDRNSIDPSGDLRFGRDIDALFGAPGDNVFLIKATYYLGL